MRSFWFYISFIQCLFQVCLAVTIVYYWHTTSTNDEGERHNNPYGLLCSVFSKKYHILAHVLLAFFLTLVFYAFMDHFYDFCLDPDDDSYLIYQGCKDQNRKKKKQKPIRRYVHHKKPEPVTTEEDWRPPLNGDHIIKEDIEDLYRKKFNDTLRRTPASPHKSSPKSRSPKRQ